MELLDSRRLTVEEQLSGLTTIVDRAHEARDQRGEVVARARAIRARIVAGHGESTGDLEALARRAISLLETADDAEGLFQIWNVLREVANNKGHYEEYARASEQMIHHGRRLGRPRTFFLPVALMLGPRPASHCLKTLAPLLADDPHPAAPSAIAYLRALLGQFEGARAVMQESADRMAELSGDIGGMRFAAEVMELEGDHEAAVGQLRRYYAALEERGEVAYLSTYYPELGRQLCMLGRYDEAEPLAQRGRELGAEDDVVTQALWRRVQALVLAHRSRHAEAEARAREAVALLDQTDALNWQGDALSDLADVLEEAGRAAEAIDTFHEAMHRYARKENLVMMTQVQERLATLTNECTNIGQ